MLLSQSRSGLNSFKNALNYSSFYRINRYIPWRIGFKNEKYFFIYIINTRWTAFTKKNTIFCSFLRKSILFLFIICYNSLYYGVKDLFFWCNKKEKFLYSCLYMQTYPNFGGLIYLSINNMRWRDEF